MWTTIFRWCSSEFGCSTMTLVASMRNLAEVKLNLYRQQSLFVFTIKQR
jgi:hypothetical protein